MPQMWALDDPQELHALRNSLSLLRSVDTVEGTPSASPNFARTPIASPCDTDFACAVVLLQSSRGLARSGLLTGISSNREQDRDRQALWCSLHVCTTSCAFA